MITLTTINPTSKAVMRFRLPSCVADFAVRRNTPESTQPTMNSPALIFRLSESGLDQRNQAIAAPPKKDAKLTPKTAIAALWLGGGGGDGISSNIARCQFTRSSAQSSRNSCLPASACRQRGLLPAGKLFRSRDAACRPPAIRRAASRQIP